MRYCGLLKTLLYLGGRGGTRTPDLMCVLYEAN